MTAITAVDPVSALPPLTGIDRCCRCVAEAYVRVSISLPDGGGTDLLFCGHHYAQHETALDACSKVFHIQDDRQRLLPAGK